MLNMVSVNLQSVKLTVSTLQMRNWATPGHRVRSFLISGSLTLPVHVDGRHAPAYELVAAAMQPGPLAPCSHPFWLEIA